MLKEMSFKFEGKSLDDAWMELVSGGTLPAGWQATVDALAPMYLQSYPGISYEEACAKLEELGGSQLGDSNDLAEIKAYIKKFF